LGAHQDEANAMETINRFLETYREGQIKTLEDVLAFINPICVKNQTAPSPVIGP
jgi:hypothetical protein